VAAAAGLGSLRSASLVCPRRQLAARLALGAIQQGQQV
jgi:hypothetical protein